MSECKYERELTAAAELLQGIIPAGKCKAIGLLEVTAGIKQLIAELEQSRADIKWHKQKAKNLRNSRLF